MKRQVPLQNTRACIYVERTYTEHHEWCLQNFSQLQLTQLQVNGNGKTTQTKSNKFPLNDNTILEQRNYCWDEMRDWKSWCIFSTRLAFDGLFIEWQSTWQSHNDSIILLVDSNILMKCLFPASSHNSTSFSTSTTTTATNRSCVW